jgi:hypothetical protein
MATGFTAGFVGSLASQGAATMMGIQDQVSMKNALISGLTTAATAGIAQGANMVNIGQKTLAALEKLSIPKVFNATTAAKAMAQNVANQSINLAISRHQHFAWDELAVAGFTAGIMDSEKGNAAKEKINPVLARADLGTGILGSELSALTNSAANAITGKTFDAKQVLVDNLGHAIGDAIVDWGAAKPNSASAVKKESDNPLNEMCLREDSLEEGAYFPIPNSTPFEEGTTYQSLKEQYAEFRYKESISENKQEPYEALAFDSDLLKSRSEPKAVQSFESREFWGETHGKSQLFNKLEKTWPTC